ncbi:MAG: hypothetical protein AAGM84_16555 [Pseudomonadota bacterium]
MSNNNGMFGCTIGCWLVAALGGAVAAILLLVLGENWTFLQAAFMGAVIAAVAGVLLSWLICRPLPALGEAKPMDPADTPLARARAEREEPVPHKPAAQPVPEAAPAAASAAAPAAATEAAPSAAAATPEPAAEIKPSTQLAGEEELAARKGTWKYEKDGAATPAPAAEPAPTAEPAPEPVPAAAPAPAAEPVDPVAEAAAAVPEGAEQKPETLSAARDGGPDDLKMIKGVGPKLEALLHSLGFFHFDQIASWKAEEVAWVDQNLQGFKGRVSRDKWVAQAKTLAAGGTTEFSSKVKKGGVYD